MCCFICFHKGHLASSCTLSNYSCNKCKQNTNSICIESKKLNDRIIQGHQVKVIRQAWTKIIRILQTANNVNNVLLQTANATATQQTM